MIVIIDYGVGNLGSVQNMLKKIGTKSLISSNTSDIMSADKLILPGVGAFDNGMKNLKDSGLIPILNHKVIKEKTPILGVCLGMQLFSKKSEEGQLPGLAWINAQTVRFKFNNDQTNLKIPHMGWNTITTKKQSPVLKNMYQDARFYFVHSYHIVCNDSQDILTTTYHGYNFTSMIQHNNLIGAQFHPEKSHKFGMKLLKNFAEHI
ncbi:imidazole glycerol phosphate synthase subunit HisH [Patescibacteria group bacterium AH-259-L05]|nr:imidazole glycerol phosphate synthase subunit HisH [Patescibacteria group bacterium AH-259-L05]